MQGVTLNNVVGSTVAIILTIAVAVMGILLVYNKTAPKTDEVACVGAVMRADSIINGDDSPQIRGEYEVARDKCLHKMSGTS